MELTSFLYICIVIFLPFLSWKYPQLGFSYYFKWVVAYFVLKWQRIMYLEKPAVRIFSTIREEYLERPRLWTREKTFKRDSMLVFAGSQDVWLLLELARGRYNSAVARVRLQFCSSGLVFQSSGTSNQGWLYKFAAAQGPITYLMPRPPLQGK